MYGAWFKSNCCRACPECRVTSDFVCPSLFWVDTKEDKNKLIDDYKTALSTKDCKYFDKGVGKCPFGNKCFYRHAFPDGRICDVGPPPRQRRRGPGLDTAAIEVLQVSYCISYTRIHSISHTIYSWHFDKLLVFWFYMTDTLVTRFQCFTLEFESFQNWHLFQRIVGVFFASRDFHGKLL